MTTPGKKCNSSFPFDRVRLHFHRHQRTQGRARAAELIAAGDEPSGQKSVRISARSANTPKELRNITNRKIVGQRFLNTPHQKKITQVFGDSSAIDWAKLPGPFDIVFIDGCHSYDYVAKDTQNALKYTRPGGLIIWHDYGYVKDVSDVVDKSAGKINVSAIAGTRLAVGIMGTSAAAA